MRKLDIERHTLIKRDQYDERESPLRYTSVSGEIFDAEQDPLCLVRLP
jgi:hypothetical protein